MESTDRNRNSGRSWFSTLISLILSFADSQRGPATPPLSSSTPRNAPTVRAQEIAIAREHRRALRAFQVREAQWVWSEMEDFVRLIQRYRSLYVTAIFVSIGWLLGQVATSARSGPQITPAQLIVQLRSRVDVAAVLCLVPVLNSFFVALIFEAQFHMQSLAQYRFLLGRELGRSIGDVGPVWRWELWKQRPEGSIRPWTIPSNVAFGLTAIVLPAGALWFAMPAVYAAHSKMLWWFWGFSATTFAGMLFTAVVLGLMNRSRNRRKLPSDLSWSELRDTSTSDSHE
jgi:hypothetical protein